MNTRTSILTLLLVSSCLGVYHGSARAEAASEFAVKREAVFEFAAPPAITREGDRVTIAFESKGFCDATVCVESGDGKIVRHLASGVLGNNAPAPFAKNSKKQTLVWDGKDDAGTYVDDKDSHTVRVSLGLKPQFERTLDWSPCKRVGGPSPVLAAGPEGVYVGENYMLDHSRHGGTQVKLYGHDGTYLRTIYPFAKQNFEKVQGLPWHRFDYVNEKLPLKVGYFGGTLLRSGTETDVGMAEDSYALAERGGRLALLYKRVLRLAADGTSGGLPLEGPNVDIKIRVKDHKNDFSASPWSAAFSPDGKTLYLAGYSFYGGWGYGLRTLHGVMKVDYESDGEAKVFAGKMTQEDFGNGPDRFKVPSSVACDGAGRVYVSDYLNDRIQVFAPDGKLLKSIASRRPMKVLVNPKNGEIIACSWYMATPYEGQGEKPAYTRFGPFDDPKVLAKGDLPLLGAATNASFYWSGGLQFRVELDAYAPEPTLWVVPAAVYARDTCIDVTQYLAKWEGIRLLVEKNGKLVQTRDLGDDADKAGVRRNAPVLWRQRLYVNPANGKLYVAEGDSGVDKSVNQLLVVDPDSGKIAPLDLPLGSEDLCFDAQGMAYLRTDKVVARYDSRTWREVPWDYGEELEKHSYGMGAKPSDLIAALVTPGHRSHSFWHLGGIDVSLNGHLLVTTCNGNKPPEENRRMYQKNGVVNLGGRPYTPQIFPGRVRWGELHVYDKYGKQVVEDAVPGLGHLNGVALDAEDNVYFLATARRTIGGKLYDPSIPEDHTGTLAKVRAGKCKVLGDSSRAEVPIPPELKPQRSTDWQGSWLEGAEWVYGGVGFCTPAACICVNTRFDMDYFNRCFAPEPAIYSVAVLDGAGNLVTRIGQPGNVDDGKPLVADGGPPATRSIGGDETALFHAAYVATETDRRLFVADQGNARIVSVKLGYHAERKIALRDVKDTKP